MATVVLIVVMFLLFDRRIKSRLAITFVGIVSAFAIYFIFQGVFEAIFNVSQSDLRLGENYIRFRAAEYYLTDFFKSPIAYITGNGMFNWDSSYGKEVTFNMVYHRYYLADIGLVGNYAIFGLLFVLGIFIILIRSLSIKIESNYMYIRLMFISMLLSVIIAAGFALSDTICFVTLAMYVIDVSNSARVAS
jgi:hypothetical protein